MRAIGSSSGKLERHSCALEAGLWGLVSVGAAILLHHAPMVHWFLESLLQTFLWLWCFRVALIFLDCPVWRVLRYLVFALALVNFVFYSTFVYLLVPLELSNYFCIFLSIVLYFVFVLSVKKVLHSKWSTR